MLSFIGLLTISLVSNEIMDTRELKYVFCKPEEFAIEMKMFAGRIKELKDVDFISSMCTKPTWPPRPFINEMLILNRGYLQYLKQCIDLYPHSRQFLEAREENSALYDIYDNIRDAQCEYYYIHIRRLALKKLKRNLDKIDPTWYDKGILPPCVPIWRFGEIK